MKWEDVHERLINNNSWNEAVVAYLKVLFQHSPRDWEKSRYISG